VIAPRCRVALVILSLVFATSRAGAQGAPARDFQAWTEIAVAYQANPVVALTAFGEVRLGSDVSRFYQELLSAGIMYSPSSSLFLGAGYLFLHANPSLSTFDLESRVYAEATLRAPPFHGLVLEDRVRPEGAWLRQPKATAYRQRYRNRVILERPVVVRAKTWVPLVSWEKFYDTSVEAWSGTRYFAGVTMPTAHQTSVQLYFMHQHDPFTRPFDNSVIGVSALFSVRSARPIHPHE
jgi:hypothetical protein